MVLLQACEGVWECSESSAALACSGCRALHPITIQQDMCKGRQRYLKTGGGGFDLSGTPKPKDSILFLKPALPTQKNEKKKKKKKTTPWALKSKSTLS